MSQAASWSTQQLAEFLVAVSSFPDEETATRGAIERAAEAFEAEVGALVRERVVTSIGYPLGSVPEAELVAAAKGEANSLEIPGAGVGAILTVPLEDELPGRILLMRSEPFSPDEVNLLRGMARVLALTLRTLRVLETERGLRAESEEHAQENARLLAAVRQRQRLLEQTTTIQRLIARRAPLQQVLDAIVSSAQDLLGTGSEVVTLRMIRAEDPATTFAVAAMGLRPELEAAVQVGRIGHGVSGRAIAEARLVVADRYDILDFPVPELIADGLQAAMAAPVHEDGAVVGSLSVASYEVGHVYNDAEQEMLLAFAQHASLALTDAKTVDSMVHQALHDSLTGLPNRALFLDRLEHALDRAEGGDPSVAVLFLDLDRFKTVNDSLGHAAGDELLIGVGARIAANVRPSDTAARLGGDEFAVLLEDSRDKSDAARLADRLATALREPFVLHGKEVFIGASIGIACGARHGQDLLRYADLAMYRAKATGHARYEFFEPEMGAAVVERLELEADLRRAVERDELVLHYQPIVHLTTGTVATVEALVRWQHPTRGLIPPLTFIPLAEETGSIVEIGRWVLREACRQAADWQRRYASDPPLGVSVNLSCRQLQQPGFVDEVATTLREARIHPQTLTLEITEGMLMENTEDTIGRLRALKELGVRLSIDDFGTGYSSLRYLRQFPLDSLKIPKPFIDDVADDAKESALTQAIIHLGRSLGLEVVAEGIEENRQLSELRKLGCELGQGFLLAKPRNAGGIDVLLRNTSRLPRAADRLTATG
jgi:diguanylate cyclase (GGDEF)-like protein